MQAATDPGSAGPEAQGERSGMGWVLARVFGRGSDRSMAALAFLAYTAVAIAATWPLATAPSRLGAPNMDVYGNMWAMAWVGRQAVHDPAHLFDSNMFFPWTKSLGYAESLLPQALQAAPVRLLGGSVLLAYNVVFLLSFALSGLGAYLLAKELGGSRGGAFLAGLSFAFFAYRWDHLVHLQSLSTQWLPLALYCARRAMQTGTTRSFAGLGLFSLLQVLSSGYYAMLVALAVGLTMAWEWWGGRHTPRLMRAVAALVLAAGLALPVFLQHRAIQARHGFSRGRTEAVGWSARVTSYLEPGPFNDLPHLAALRAQTRDREPLFPGTWALVFGALGLLVGARSRNAGLATLWLLIGFSLSLGPVVNVFGWSVPGPFELFRALPGGALLRTPARLGVLAVLALDMLAALAWTRLLRTSRAPRAWLAIAGAVVALETHPSALRGAIREMPRPGAAAQWLARAERGVVLELPWNEPADSALYLYWSTTHWQPMVNGFGSFDPPDNFGLGLLGNRWPTEYSARVFRERGVRYVLAHVDRLRPAHQERLLAASVLPAGVSLRATFGDERIYEIAGGLVPDQKEKPSETEGSAPTATPSR